MFEYIKNYFCKHPNQSFLGNKNIVKSNFFGSVGSTYSEGKADIHQCSDCGKQIEKNFIAQKTVFFTNTPSGVKKSVLERK